MGEWEGKALYALQVMQHELLLFAGVFFLIGLIDEIAIDITWLWLRLTGRARTPQLESDDLGGLELNGLAAVFIPAWREDRVIGHTIAHALAAWPQCNWRLYVGCYPNDPATLEAAMQAAAGDPRVRLIVHHRAGPTTKADCLNRLYQALRDDEARTGQPARLVVLHDAEDMVDPAALVLLDRAIEQAEFVQLPVLPQPQPASRWIGSHYCEEFAEAHAKSLVVRARLAGLPAAGVGCALARGTLIEMGRREADPRRPFAEGSLTEDYELGLKVAAAGGRSRFLRVRTASGRLVATRAYFPSDLAGAVKQKGRWVHGIALQGWDRLGWEGGPGECWMRLRDRRGPLAALVLLAGYALLLLSALMAGLKGLGLVPGWQPSSALTMLLAANLAGIVWRVGGRFAFTAREYGPLEGLRAILRIPVANIIAIMAARRALVAYVRTLKGAALQWDKTEHDKHPAGSQASAGAVRA